MSEQSSAGDDAADEGPAPSAAGADGTAVDGEPSTDGSAAPGDPPRVVGLDSDGADDVIGAVASDTAREVLAALHEEPSTASGVADRVDCSLQTVQYHVDNLAGAGLVEAVDTATSEKGREMTVYGPAEEPVVVYAGDEGRDDLRAVLSRLVSGVAVLGLASLFVQEVLGGGVEAFLGRSDEAVTLSTGGAEAAPAAGAEPGLVFFAGGLVVLVAALAVAELRRRDALPSLAGRP